MTYKLCVKTSCVLKHLFFVYQKLQFVYQNFYILEKCIRKFYYICSDGKTDFFMPLVTLLHLKRPECYSAGLSRSVLMVENKYLKKVFILFFHKFIHIHSNSV